jgi:hypothetical protein
MKEKHNSIYIRDDSLNLFPYPTQIFNLHFRRLPRSINYNIFFSPFFPPAEERETVQKKTFTKWVNSHLVRVNTRINDLYVDMRDGKNLIKLLEILSGERLPRPTKGKMRIHCLENVDKALQFLREQRVHLENIGSHDVTVRLMSFDEYRKLY